MWKTSSDVDEMPFPAAHPVSLRWLGEDQRQPGFQLLKPKPFFPLNARITFTKTKFINPPLKVMFSTDCTVPQLPDIRVALGLTVKYSIRFCGEKRHSEAA